MLPLPAYVLGPLPATIDPDVPRWSLAPVSVAVDHLGRCPRAASSCHVVTSPARSPAVSVVFATLDRVAREFGVTAKAAERGVRSRPRSELPGSRVGERRQRSHRKYTACYNSGGRSTPRAALSGFSAHRTPNDAPCRGITSLRRTTGSGVGAANRPRSHPHCSIQRRQK